jgi:hypothetical protein
LQSLSTANPPSSPTIAAHRSAGTSIPSAARSTAPNGVSNHAWGRRVRALKLTLRSGTPTSAFPGSCQSTSTEKSMRAMSRQKVIRDVIADDRTE